MKRIFDTVKVTILLCSLHLLPSTGQAQSTYLAVEDIRDVGSSPSDYKRVLKPTFKWGPLIGFSSPRYYTVLGLNGWMDDSGGPSHELAFSNLNGIYHRTGTLAAGWTGWRKILAEDASGNVGIGTESPQAKLAVNGSILATQIKVKTDITVPDYVFEPDYELPSLKSIEHYVKLHRHLPEIPSASKIANEGLDLAEMNLLLLKKIEEMTLQMIDLNKKLRKQGEEIEVMKSKIR